MTLVSGSCFSFYQIAESIGAGGMGEVYRATDTRLKRDVAIKVLPESFAMDAERLARFQREAELLASLNHHNIAQIHGIETANGITALIMELIEGPTLAERIEQGPLPPEEALHIALQIADALEAAHERQVVHRDLKPANIKLRPDGTVKVLDFGIAKALDNQSGNSGPQSPALTTLAMTQAGMIMGTAAYMSPEQARGKLVDRRADIWAFGCVLYEMLTGQPAFGGEDVPLTLARVLSHSTDMQSLPRGVPPALRHTIELCLEKDPHKRIADIRDVRLALKGRIGLAVPQTAGETTAVGLTLWQRVLPVAGTLAVSAVVAAMVYWLVLQPGPQPVNRFAYGVPDAHRFRNSGATVMAVAPNGRHFVYNTTQGLYLRELGALEARLIPGTEESITNPVFSPDSQSVAYISAATNQLKRIAISGGSPVVISALAAIDTSGLSWAADNTLVASRTSAIYRVSANGGTPQLLVQAQSGEQFSNPELLPDGDTLLFSISNNVRNWDQANIVAQSLSTGERKVLIQGGGHPHYLPTGHLLYALGNDLLAVAFDAGSLAVSGGAVPVVQGVQRGGFSGSANYNVAADGTLVYLSGTTAFNLRNLVWVDRAGGETAIPIVPSVYTYPRISPAGDSVALDDRNAENSLWVWDFAGETRTRLTLGGLGAYYPAWAVDGTRLAFYTLGSGNIDWIAANNTGTIENLATNLDIFGQSGTVELDPYFFAPSGQVVFRSAANPATGDDVGMITPGSDDEPVWLLREPYMERNAELSPNGRWMAYQSDESGQYEIYVRPFPNVNDDRVQVSNAGGRQPLWSRDGTELFYLTDAGGTAQLFSGSSSVDSRLMGVSVETGEAVFTFSARTAIMDWPYFYSPNGRTYDVAPDGQRFIAIREVVNAPQDAAPAEVIIVQNWLDALERQVPAE